MVIIMGLRRFWWLYSCISAEIHFEKCLKQGKMLLWQYLKILGQMKLCTIEEAMCGILGVIGVNTW